MSLNIKMSLTIKISLDEKKSLNINISLNLNIEFCTICGTIARQPRNLPETYKINLKYLVIQEETIDRELYIEFIGI